MFNPYIHNLDDELLFLMEGKILDNIKDFKYSLTDNAREKKMYRLKKIAYKKDEKAFNKYWKNKADKLLDKRELGYGIDESNSMCDLYDMIDFWKKTKDNIWKSLNKIASYDYKSEEDLTKDKEVALKLLKDVDYAIEVCKRREIPMKTYASWYGLYLGERDRKKGMIAKLLPDGLELDKIVLTYETLGKKAGRETDKVERSHLDCKFNAGYEILNEVNRVYIKLLKTTRLELQKPIDFIRPDKTK